MCGWDRQDIADRRWLIHAAEHAIDLKTSSTYRCRRLSSRLN